MPRGTRTWARGGPYRLQPVAISCGPAPGEEWRPASTPPSVARLQLQERLDAEHAAVGVQRRGHRIDRGGYQPPPLIACVSTLVIAIPFLANGQGAARTSRKGDRGRSAWVNRRIGHPLERGVHVGP